MKHLASILTIGALVPLMWATVVPQGKDLCSSATAFNFHPDNSAGQAAGVGAKAKFCRLVTNN